MEFIWNVEEQKISKLTNSGIEAIVDSMTMEEQIKAIEKYGEYKFSIREELNLREQFLADSEKGIIKESANYKKYPNSYYYNRFNYASLKSWLKKHGRVVYDYEDYSDLIKLKGYSYWDTYSAIGYLDDESVDRYVRDLFCRMLRGTLSLKENRYFEQHDEYTIEQNKLSHRPTYFEYAEGLGFHFSFWSNGQIDIHKGDGDGVKATLEELKALNEFYDNLDKEVKDFFTEKFKNFPIKA